MLNIHPSLLPAFPGMNTHRRALEAGCSQHGASIHFVTEAVDGGPVVLQAQVPVQPTGYGHHTGGTGTGTGTPPVPAGNKLVCRTTAATRQCSGQATLDGKILTEPVILTQESEMPC